MRTKAWRHSVRLKRMRLQYELAKKRGVHLFFWELAADEICRQRRGGVYGPEVGRETP